MTRFRILLVTAVPAGAIALALGHAWLSAGIAAAFVAITGLGVASPRLRLFGPFVCRGSTARRCVALTFDDGPDPRSTPALLDLLREANVKATFFCVGKRVQAERELAQRIVREGHLIGNHSFAHHYFTSLFSVDRMRSELTQAQRAIEEAVGFAPEIYRPPIGHSNPNVFRVASELRLKVIGWSIRSFDTIITKPERVVRRISRQLAPGAIVLLHDGNIPPERVLPTVKMLLATLRERGYEVVRLDEILKA